jgi:hypothetical protein
VKCKLEGNVTIHQNRPLGRLTPCFHAAEFTNGLYQFDPVLEKWAKLGVDDSAGAPPSNRISMPIVGTEDLLYVFGGYLDSGSQQAPSLGGPGASAAAFAAVSSILQQISV